MGWFALIARIVELSKVAFPNGSFPLNKVVYLTINIDILLSILLIFTETIKVISLCFGL